MGEVASASLVKLARAKETTYGVAPTTGANYNKMRFTGESLSQEVQTVSSNEIVEGRETADLIRTDLGAGGSINFELSHGTYDPELAALFHENTGDYVAGAAATVASSNITLTNTVSGDFSSLSSHVGKFCEVVVRASGPGAIEQRVLARLAHVTSTTSADFDYMEKALTNATGKNITITVGGVLTNGVTRQSFTYERSFPDAENGAGNFAYNTGYSPNSMNLSIAAGSIITGSFDYVGSRETAATSVVWTGSQTAATTTKVMNGIDHVVAILENGVTFRLTKMDLTIGNNLSAHKAIALLGALELSSEQLAVSGSIQAYFNTKAMFDKFLNFTDTNFVLMFRDDANKCYVLHLPDVKFTSGKRNASGINQPVMADLSFGAIKDPTLGKTMKLFSIVSA